MHHHHVLLTDSTIIFLNIQIVGMFVKGGGKYMCSNCHSQFVREIADHESTLQSTTMAH